MLWPACRARLPHTWNNRQTLTPCSFVPGFQFGGASFSGGHDIGAITFFRPGPRPTQSTIFLPRHRIFLHPFAGYFHAEVPPAPTARPFHALVNGIGMARIALNLCMAAKAKG